MLPSESEPEQDKVCGCDVWAMFGWAICDGSRLCCVHCNDMTIALQGSFFFSLSLFFFRVMRRVKSVHIAIFTCVAHVLACFLSLPPVLDDVVEKNTKQRGRAGMVQKLLGVWYGGNTKLWSSTHRNGAVVTEQMVAEQKLSLIPMIFFYKSNSPSVTPHCVCLFS